MYQCILVTACNKDYSVHPPANSTVKNIVVPNLVCFAFFLSFNSYKLIQYFPKNSSVFANKCSPVHAWQELYAKHSLDHSLPNFSALIFNANFIGFIYLEIDALLLVWSCIFSHVPWRDADSAPVATYCTSCSLPALCALYVGAPDALLASCTLGASCTPCITSPFRLLACPLH